MARVPKEWIRGAGPLAVMKLLAGGDKYGYEIADALDRTSEGVLAVGHSTLYPLLYNLEGKGLIERKESRRAGGRLRKYYGLTDEGRAWLARQEREWSDLVAAMERLGLT